MRNTPYTIDELKKIARTKGGKLLTSKYQNSSIKLKWQCKFGHNWDAKPRQIISGAWCPKCGIVASRQAKIKYSILEMQSLAKKHNGKCLSKKYVTSSVNLDWQCDKGHIFPASPQKVKDGNWCPFCAGRGKTIEDLQKIAMKRGGKCLSTEFHGVKGNVQWECKYGHRWSATPDNVINKESWCTQCSSGKGESLVRIFFEELFQAKFPKVRPDWLRNEEENKLELDGYNEKLGIAFEHQGEFHYRKIRKYTTSDIDFKRRLKLDQIKKKICKAQGVVLIEVPEVGNLLKKDQLKEYILKQLISNKIKLPANYKELSPDYEKQWVNGDNDKLESAKRFIESKKGKLLSTVYLGTSYKLKLECEFGHSWEALPHNVFKGRWCPVCNGNRVITIAQMQSLAISRGGKCLSNTYFDNLTHLVWECEKGDQWAATPSNVMRGTWCSKCNRGQKPNLETLERARKKTIK